MTHDTKLHSVCRKSGKMHARRKQTTTHVVSMDAIRSKFIIFTYIGSDLVAWPYSSYAMLQRALRLATGEGVDGLHATTRDVFVRRFRDAEVHLFAEDL